MAPCSQEGEKGTRSFSPAFTLVDDDDEDGDGDDRRNRGGVTRYAATLNLK